VGVAAAVAASGWPLLALLAVPVAARPARRVLGGESGSGLIEVLGATGQVVLMVGVLLSVGLVL